MRAGLIQLNSSDTPAANLPVTEALIRKAASEDADLVLTPEVTNCVSTSRARQADVLQTQAQDITLKRLRVVASELRIWLLIGSLALKGEADKRFVNRSFLIGPNGAIRARYDKIHMFDVTLEDGEAYHESAGYRPGETACLAKTPLATLGLTICYDLRFPALYRQLAKAGAQILTIPSAFTVPTGQAHWEVLLRARAIECGAFVLAPAQCGTHDALTGKPRKTYGHSLVVAPWGEVLLDMGDGPGVACVDLDLDQVATSRARVPALSHDRDHTPPSA